MKKLLIGFFAFVIAFGNLMAQDAKKDFKEGLKKLENFSKDPANNGADLTEAMGLIETGMSDSEISGNAKEVLKLGQAYNAVANAEMRIKLLDPAYNLSFPEAGKMALEAFNMVMALGDKQKDALNGIMETQGLINNIAITYFQAQDYANAFDNYKLTLDAHNVLSQNGKESMLDDATVMADQKFYTAATGYYGGKVDQAMPILEELYANKVSEALVYEALYNAKKDSDPAMALQILEEGRTLLPDDAALLFAEINHYLTAGKLDQLISKLEVAKEKEPDNLSVVVTMGSVYDQLNQKEREAGNEDKAEEYFAKDKAAYEEVLAADPTNFDATYSVGALYYNKAASLTDEINALADDFSPAGTKKYQALKDKMDALFGEANPWFLKAEAINKDDLNTLIALKEIAARSNDFAKAEEYKTRIEALTGK